MSATYNWAYKPGVTNKYGLVVPASLDSVKPTGFVYVALFGNDITGNGSREYPVRTLQKAFASFGGFQNYIIASGTYREYITTNFGGPALYGDGDVVIDVSYQSAFGSFNNTNCSFINIKVRGNGLSYANGGLGGSGYFCYDNVYDGALPSPSAAGLNNDIANSVFSNIGLAMNMSNVSNPSFNATNCTFYNCQSVALTINKPVNACIFYKCNISANTVAILAKTQYCLFYQCNFKITNGTDVTVPKLQYPSVPTGYTCYSDVTTLRTAILAYDSAIINPLIGCIIADPKFNNLAIGDLTLAFDSPAKNLSYFGTYAGACSLAYAIKAKTNESAGDFDFSSATNLTIADDSITFTNPALDAQIDTNVIGNLISRELAKVPSYGFNADRNGQYIDSIADLAGSTITAGGTLSIPVPYLVETGAITYNSNVYQPGDRFTTVTGVATFITGSGGVVREILEAPQRHTIMARFSDGGGAVTAGTALVADNWYSVLAGSVTYDSVPYNAPAIFKAAGTNSFSGSGTVELAMSTESYQHYEPNIRPLSNNVGDARTGAIVRGNGDPEYIRGGVGVKEFPINAKYLQFRYYLKASNLKP